MNLGLLRYRRLKFHKNFGKETQFFENKLVLGLNSISPFFCMKVLSFQWISKKHIFKTKGKM